MPDTNIGAPRSRVDGRAKVTGTATYAAEFATQDVLRSYVVSSAITRGRIRRIDTSRAKAVPGVIEVLTHENRPRTARSDSKYQDEVAPPGSPFRPLQSDEIQYAMQPVALVVAEDFETARYAATLLDIEYKESSQQTDFEAQLAKKYVPPKKRNGITPPAKAPRRRRGRARRLAGQGRRRVSDRGRVPQPDGAARDHRDLERRQDHRPRQDPGRRQRQGLHHRRVRAERQRRRGDLTLCRRRLRLRPASAIPAFLAVMAALALKRSVRVELTRDQMFTFTHRPRTMNTLALGATRDGTLQALRHDAVQATSQFEDYQEVVVNWSGLAYSCPNVLLTYELAKLDIYTPGDMRAPGAPTGFFAIESAMDELAYATGVDPMQLRLKNHSDTDENEGKPYTSKELRAAYAAGAERFGWRHRSPEPRSMKEGRELIGWGMATGVWEAMFQQTSARATLTADGKLEIGCGASDIGTGTYTILAQIAADTLGVPMEDVTVRLADTSLPPAPTEGGSWTAASSGAAVQLACTTVREQLFAAARGASGSPLRNVPIEHAVFAGGRIALDRDPAQSIAITDILSGKKLDKIEATETVKPDPANKKKFSAYTHSVAFVEVRVDEELGQVRVTRVVCASAAGKILNPKTARSQVIGGVVWGIGMALHEEAMTDTKIGRVMNHNFAEYHVPACADVPDIDVIFVDERDDKVSPMGVKGVGEIGIVATPAAIANAIYHATGKRIRSLPITIDKVFGA